MINKSAPISPKIFLYGYYGFDNVGDDLLLSSVVSTIFQFFPKASFVVRSLTPVSSVVDERIQFVELERIMVRKERPRWQRLTSYALATWHSLRGCSHLIFGGGTLFHAREGSSINLALIAMLVVMARLRGAKVFALGVGVAPLPKGMPRFLLGVILKLAQDFAVRDASSLANCRDIRGVTSVRRTADLVFALSLKTLPRAVNYRPILGITLAASDIGHNSSGNESFLKNLASALERLQELGWDIRFLSFQELDFDGLKISDSALVNELTRYGMKHPITWLRVSSDPSELSRQFSDIDIIAGMRFHGHVLAALLGIPFVGFGRDSKVLDLCEYFSMPFLAMNDLQASQLVAAVEQTLKQTPNREKTLALSEASATNFNNIKASIL